MRNDLFTSVCLSIIICMLGLIALEFNTVPAKAARRSTWEVISVTDGLAGDEIQRHAQSGWELVAAPFWANSNMTSGSSGLLIFRK